MSVSTSPISAPPVVSSPPSAVSTNDKGISTVTNGIDERKYNLVTLPSGKKIKLIAIAPLHFAPGGDPPALMLKYQTDLPIKNVPALQKEADAIWKDFRIEVEKGGFTSALISASDAPKGRAVWHKASYTFVWKKDNRGKWRRQ